MWRETWLYRLLMLRIKRLRLLRLVGRLWNIAQLSRHGPTKRGHRGNARNGLNGWHLSPGGRCGLLWRWRCRNMNVRWDLPR